MIVYTTGVFDLLHRGHFNLLTKARALGSKLVVGVQEDDSIQKCKGRKPILTTEERVEQLQALPFVSEVITYRGADQIPYYKQVRPDIIVQGDDWIHSGDRSKLIDYLRKKDIRLVLYPYTKGISSTEIKRRVAETNERSDRKFILENIRLFQIEKLSLYESFDENKIKRLVTKIKKEGVFINPITVASSGKLDIVIDGVNRLEALKRLGIKQVTALYVDYEKDVELRQNIHYLRNGKLTRLSEFGDEGVGVERYCPKYTKKNIIQLVQKGEMIPSGYTWHKTKSAIINLEITLDQLRKKLDMKQLLKKLIEENQIRYYPSNVYTCNEWIDK